MSDPDTGGSSPTNFNDLQPLLESRGYTADQSGYLGTVAQSLGPAKAGKVVDLPGESGRFASFNRASAAADEALDFALPAVAKDRGVIDSGAPVADFAALDDFCTSGEVSLDATRARAQSTSDGFYRVQLERTVTYQACELGTDRLPVPAGRRVDGKAALAAVFEVKQSGDALTYRKIEAVFDVSLEAVTTTTGNARVYNGRGKLERAFSDPTSRGGGVEVQDEIAFLGIRDEASARFAGWQDFTAATAYNLGEGWASRFAGRYAHSRAGGYATIETETGWHPAEGQSCGTGEIHATGAGNSGFALRWGEAVTTSDPIRIAGLGASSGSHRVPASCSAGLNVFAHSALARTSVEATTGKELADSLGAAYSDRRIYAVELSSDVGNGTLDLQGPALTYRSNAGFAGTDSFSVAVANGRQVAPATSVSVDVALPDWVTAIPKCGSPPFAYFKESAFNQPTKNSGNYTKPGSSGRSAFKKSVTAATNGNGSTAASEANSAGYRLCRGPSPDAQWLVWKPDTAGTGQARAALNWDSRAAGLIVEAPHSFYETDTLPEAVQMARDLNARGLVTTGTHRCANDVDSGCDGTTGVCGSTDAFRESDMAHTVESMFHQFHLAAVGAYPAASAISLHGTGSNKMIASNGTELDAAADRPVNQLYSALDDDSLSTGPDVKTCNDFPGADDTGFLCGTTNVQGRQLNGVADECTSSASSASDRFLHLEQDLDVRKDDKAKVIQAVREALGL